MDITRNGNTTVIITTHYIEETRQAHVIGLMRGGRFLAEESPSELLHHYSADSLEDVFLKLAVMQTMGKRRRSSIAKEVIDSIQLPAMANPALDITDEHGEISGEFGDNISMSSRGPDMVTPEIIAPPLPPVEEPKIPWTKKIQFLRSNHMKALIWKNFLWMWRNFGVMAFIIGLPVMQIILFCLAVGHDPVGLKLVVSNHELDESFVGMQECPVYNGCNYTYLSCRYLEFLKNRSVVIQHVNTDSEALDQVQRGKAWGALVFASNYSDALVERTEAGRDIEEWNLEASDMAVTMDMSDQQIGTLLFRDIQFAYFDFISDLLSDCGINPIMGRVPLQWNKPIYGDEVPNFTDFAAPGVILT